MMEAARTSETSVDNYFTRQYIPEDKSELHTRLRENLKSHMNKTGLVKLLCRGNSSAEELALNLNSINQLIFVMVKCGVLFEVRTEFLYTVQTSSGFKGLRKFLFFLRLI
jgi:hypothetical protein